MTKIQAKKNKKRRSIPDAVLVCTLPKHGQEAVSLEPA